MELRTQLVPAFGRGTIHINCCAFRAGGDGQKHRARLAKDALYMNASGVSMTALFGLNLKIPLILPERETDRDDPASRTPRWCATATQ